MGYGNEVKDALEKLNGTPERAGYILMDIIQPPLIRNWVIRPGMKPFMDDTVSELGIFGVVIGNVKEIFHNSVSGHMLRTKIHTYRRRCCLWIRIFRLTFPYRFVAKL